jgi:hypothetical protein
LDVSSGPGGLVGAMKVKFNKCEKDDVGGE